MVTHQLQVERRTAKKRWPETGVLYRWATRTNLGLAVDKVDNLSREQMCAGSEFQVDGAGTENVREVKLLEMPESLVRKCVLDERKALNGR